jgi:MFS family permease
MSRAPRSVAGRAVPWTFPLAFFGPHLAFMPVLVLLLPRRVEAIAGDGAPLALSWMLLAGAFAASAGNIVAGHLSDRWLRRHGSRRGIIAIGLAALVASFVFLAFARTVPQALAALVAFQLALNLAFAPVGALLADYVPDGAKGSVAGVMGAALPLSVGGIALIAWLFPEDGAAAFLVNGLLVAACMAPLLILWGFGDPLVAAESAAPTRQAAPAPGRRDFALTWAARFLVQLGAAFVFGFLFLLVASRIQADPAWAGRRNASQAMALLSLGGACLGFVGAIAGGRLSDGLQSRRLPQAIAAAALALGIGALAVGVPWPFFAAAYALFQFALAAFLAVNVALAAQLVGDSPRRGALLGVMNLANTVPAVLAPAFLIASAGTGPDQGRLPLFFLAGALTAACASIAVLLLRPVVAAGAAEGFARPF